MKRHTRRDIWMLLGSLVVFSLIIGFLFRDPEAHAQEGELQPLTIDQLVERLAPLIDSGSMQMVAQSLSSVPYDQKEKIVRHLVDSSYTRLTTEQKRELIFDLALRASNMQHKDAFFTFLLQLQEGDPVLYTAAKVGYEKVIPLILQWLKKNPDLSNQWSLRALEKTIDAQRLDIYHTLLNQGVIMSKAEAQDLLWRTINQKSKAIFIPELIKQGATLHTAKEGRSPLIRAVEQNDKELVAMILELGAEVNAMADPAVGTALQRSIELHYPAIELLLREKNARE